MFSPESPAPCELQFGIQVQYLARPGDLEPFPDPLEGYGLRTKWEARREERRRYQAHLLQSNGLQSAVQLERSGSGPMYVVDASTFPSYTERDEKYILFRYWQIRGIAGLKPLVDFAYWYETELQTPILPEREAAADMPLVSQALHILYDGHYQAIHLSKCCGMFFHTSPVQGLDVRHAQRVATLVFLLEVPLLFRLCAHSRGDQFLKLERGARFVLERRDMEHTEEVFADEVDAWLPCSFLETNRDKMRRLWGALDVDGVGRMIEAGVEVSGRTDTTALRVNRRCLSVDTYGYSLEFRHAQASFNAVFVRHWAELLLLIVKLAALPRQDYSSLVERLWETIDGATNESDIWPQLLRQLNAKTPVTWGSTIDEAYWAARVPMNMDPGNDNPDVGPDQIALTG